MKLKSTVNGACVLLAAALVGSLAGGAAFAAGPVLKTGDVAQVGQWYGRAGGLTGSDRVANLQGHATASTDIAITYDKDVAARTNMSTSRAGTSTVGISYDKDVAARTNMPRGSEPEPIQSAQSNR